MMRDTHPSLHQISDHVDNVVTASKGDICVASGKVASNVTRLSEVAHVFRRSLPMARLRKTQHAPDDVLISLVSLGTAQVASNSLLRPKHSIQFAVILSSDVVDYLQWAACFTVHR